MVDYGIIDYMTFLRSKGLDSLAEDQYHNVLTWYGWYRGYVESVHNYYVYCGGERKQRRRLSLNMPKKVCEDIADFLLNERVKITAADETTGEYLDSVLNASAFYVLGNEYQERKAATGTVAYVPSIRNANLDSAGRVISGDVKIRYYDALHIFPVHWDGQEVIDCAFATETVSEGSRYAMIQYHRLDTEAALPEYVIETYVIDSMGQALDKAVWDRIPMFHGIPERVATGSAEPQFVLDRLACVNNMDGTGNSPMGIPIFANATDVLRKIDTEYDSYNKEFVLGKKRIFVAPELVTNVDGKPVFDSDDDTYVQLPDGFLKDQGKAIVESNMEIRAEEHESAINQDLNLLSMKCGFGTQYYKFDKGTVTTATQVISENSDLYRTIKKHELPLEHALRRLFRIILRLGTVTGAKGLKEDTDIVIDFDDSIIEDKATEREQDRKDVAMGVMSLPEYRAKWYGETLEEAAKKIPDQLEGAGVIQ